MIAGAVIFLWALRTLTINTSLEVKGKLITVGPYKHSKNPQYMGLVLFFSGKTLFFNSFDAFVIGFIGNVWFLLTAFVEEPWLKEQFREKYDEYCRKVPRYI